MTSVEEKIKVVLDQWCWDNTRCDRCERFKDASLARRECYLCYKNDALAREIAEIQEGKA